MSHADLTCSQVKVMSRKQTGASSALPSLLDPLVPDGEWVRDAAAAFAAKRKARLAAAKVAAE